MLDLYMGDCQAAIGGSMDTSIGSDAGEMIFGIAIVAAFSM